MPRPPRADEAGGLYHALNRGNSRAEIFHKEADFEAFERILGEGLQLYAVQLFSYQLMPNHWHLILRPGREVELLRPLDHVRAGGDEEPAEGTYDKLEDELGDLLFQVMIHSALAIERGEFTVADVARRVHDKLVYRHPHVFGTVDVEPVCAVPDPTPWK